MIGVTLIIMARATLSTSIEVPDQSDGITPLSEAVDLNNFWLIVPPILVVCFLLPTMVELRRRRDKGPRKMADETTYREKSQVDLCQQLLSFDEVRIDRIGKEVRVQDGSDIKENLIADGDLIVGKNCFIRGTIKANGSTIIGESSIIDGNILSRGQVTVYSRCILMGAIISTQDIVLHDAVIVEVVTTDKNIRLGRFVRINRKTSGTIISDLD